MVLIVAVPTTVVRLISLRTSTLDEGAPNNGIGTEALTFTPRLRASLAPTESPPPRQARPPLPRLRRALGEGSRPPKQSSSATIPVDTTPVRVLFVFRLTPENPMVGLNAVISKPSRIVSVDKMPAAILPSGVMVTDGPLGPVPSDSLKSLAVAPPAS